MVLPIIFRGPIPKYRMLGGRAVRVPLVYCVPKALSIGQNSVSIFPRYDYGHDPLCFH